MLRLIITSGASALLYTALIDVLDIVFFKELEVERELVIWNIILFRIRFAWTGLLMYLSCEPFTIITGIVWMWIPELVKIPILWFGNVDYCSTFIDCDILVSIAVGIVSVLLCIFTSFMPSQEIVNINDLADSKMVNSESVESVLDYFQETVGNEYDGPRFSVEKSGMRKVNNEDVLVYHVSDKKSEQYIPGYVIQKDGKSPEVIQKRIYFDESFYFGKDAKRAVRKKYQTEILGKHMFDIDDEYNPYEIFLYRENLLFSDGGDYGIIVLNLNDGTSEKYSESSGEIPEWVDFKSTYPR